MFRGLLVVLLFLAGPVQAEQFLYDRMIVCSEERSAIRIAQSVRSFGRDFALLQVRKRSDCYLTILNVDGYPFSVKGRKNGREVRIYQVPSTLYGIEFVVAVVRSVEGTV